MVIKLVLHRREEAEYMRTNCFDLVRIFFVDFDHLFPGVEPIDL